MFCFCTSVIYIFVIFDLLSVYRNLFLTWEGDRWVGRQGSANGMARLIHTQYYGFNIGKLDWIWSLLQLLNTKCLLHNAGGSGIVLDAGHLPWGHLQPWMALCLGTIPGNALKILSFDTLSYIKCLMYTGWLHLSIISASFPLLHVSLHSLVMSCIYLPL